jgi:hypothetical protein
MLATKTTPNDSGGTPDGARTVAEAAAAAAAASTNADPSSAEETPAISPLAESKQQESVPKDALHATPPTDSEAAAAAVEVTMEDSEAGAKKDAATAAAATTAAELTAQEAADKAKAAEVAEAKKMEAEKTAAAALLLASTTAAAPVDVTPQEAAKTLKYLLSVQFQLVPQESSHFQPHFPGMLLSGDESTTFAADPTAAAHEHPKRPYMLMWKLDDQTYRSAETQDGDTVHYGELCPLLPYWSFYPGSGQPGSFTCAAAAAVLADCRLDKDANSQQYAQQLRELAREEFTSAEFSSLSSITSNSLRSNSGSTAQSEKDAGVQGTLFAKYQQEYVSACHTLELLQNAHSILMLLCLCGFVLLVDIHG